MARKAIVDKDRILSMLSEGKTTQAIAEIFGVSRQAIDLHRKDFIRQGLLHDQRAARATKRTGKKVGRITHRMGSLDEQIELIIAAFGALKRLPELEKELETYKRKYEDATREIENLQAKERKRQDQELRWLHCTVRRGQGTPL